MVEERKLTSYKAQSGGQPGGVLLLKKQLFRTYALKMMFAYD